MNTVDKWLPTECNTRPYTYPTVSLHLDLSVHVWFGPHGRFFELADVTRQIHDKEHLLP